MSYSTQPLADLLARLATGEPVPGGGPAAGIAAALGTSLVMMAAKLAQARAGAGGDVGELTSTLDRLRSRHVELLTLADEDSVAYASVLAAYRLPKSTTAGKDARAAAIEIAMHAATEVPLGMMRSCALVLREAVVVAARVPARATIDLAIGVELVDASLRGCRMCVDANAGVLTPGAARSLFALQGASIHAEGSEYLTRIRTTLTSRSGPSDTPVVREPPQE